MPAGNIRKNFGFTMLICMSLLATGASAAPAPKSPDAEMALDQDPLSGYNHAMFGVNRTFDGVILRPVTSVYRGVVPEEGRQMASNFIENLYTPVVFANSVLQADPQNSFATFWRFALNTTFGLGGLFDFAGANGLKNRQTDFGQTLAIYGVESGPYVVLPVIGPSNVRDSFGRLADAFLNPLNYLGTGESLVLWSATAIDQRSQNMKVIDSIYETSLDPYTTFRSGYTQKRASDIRRAKAERNKALEKARAQ